MQELLVDFITSLEGCASAEGWPGWWGLEGPEYLGWLEEQPERDYTLLMGANTYRLMSGFATEPPAEPGPRKPTVWPSSQARPRLCSPPPCRRLCRGPTPSW